MTLSEGDKRMLIDPRVHYVGMTALRTLSFDRLPQDEIYVLQDRGNPVAVIVPYELYMDIQQRALPTPPESATP